MNSSSKTLVLSYNNPDLDTYGCALAYAELLNHQGHNAHAGTFGTPIAEVQFVLNYLGQTPLPELNPTTFEHIRVVDCSWPGNLDDRLDANKVIEIIDHRHGSDPNDFPSAKRQIEIVGAAATLIAEKFQQADIDPSPTAASLLLAGILSNSMNLQSAITCQRDHDMVAWLKQFTNLPDNFVELLFSAKSDVAGHKLHTQLYSDATTPIEQGFSIAQLEMVGAPKVVAERTPEVLATLDLIKAENQLEAGAFAALIDINERRTYFVTHHPTMQAILNRTLQLNFKHNIASLPQILLRKQYIPDIKQSFRQLQEVEVA